MLILQLDFLIILPEKFAKLYRYELSEIGKIISLPIPKHTMFISTRKDLISSASQCFVPNTLLYNEIIHVIFNPYLANVPFYNP